MDFEGPSVALTTVSKAFDSAGKKMAFAPKSAALSPDGKTLYLTAYLVSHFTHASNDIVGNGTWDAFHCVLKMDMEGDQSPTLFAGSLDVGKSGSDPKSFNVPASVSVDKVGRVYVADFGNNRVQIFSPDGTYLKSLNVPRPAIVSIAGQSQEIYVFSSLVYNTALMEKKEKINCQLTVFNAFENASKKLSCKIPDGLGSAEGGFWYSGQGVPLSAAVDDSTSPPTLWFANEWQRENVLTRNKINYAGIELYTLDNGQLKPKRSFNADVLKSVKRLEVPRYARSRLYVNPVSGHLFVAEGETYDFKAVKNLLEIDPESGSIDVRPIPFDAEDMCFDSDGILYLRSPDTVLRYDLSKGREIPWDYGEEKNKVFTSASSDRKEAPAISGLMIPCNGGWHQGGLYVSAKGNLAVVCGLAIVPTNEKEATGKVGVTSVAYQPQIYPGRCVDGRGGAPLVHIWDKHGKQIATDILPGLGGAIYGLGLDPKNNVTLMSSNTRMVNANVYPNKLTGTILKVAPNKAKIFSQSGTLIPLAAANQPTRSPDLRGAACGSAWIEGSDWMYGGVGYDGKNAGVGCGCWNARFAFDYFGRSFAPEVDRYQVAVLDSNGNLILRIGKYGNADSAGAKSTVPIGGDEVGMVHGAYLATHTDHRLFIADVSSDRIFSVKLDYHQTEKVSLGTAK
jgi:sugar lactone lactonase YvrE